MKSQLLLSILTKNFLVKAFNDKKFIEENIEYLEKEFQFWMVNRTKEVTIEGETYKLARYNVEVDEPRPGNNRHFCLMPRLFVRFSQIVIKFTH